MRISDHATVLISDRNMIVPTTQAALQLAEAGRNLTDVIMITGGLEPGEILDLREFLDAHNVKLLDSAHEITSLLSEFHFDDTHVTATSLGRLLMADLLPAQYQHILYIDGDTFVVGDLTDLFRLRVPSGRIAASLESLFVHWDSTSEFAEKLRTYRQKHSILGPRDYFNAGILAADRSTWRSIGPEALSFYKRHHEDCIYHDQSALNVVCENRVHWISPEFNFLSDFRMMGFEAHIRPKLYHFSGAAKPWNSRFTPWPVGTYGRYEALANANPVLAPFVRTPDKEHLRKIRNRLVAHAVTEAPGIVHPRQFIKKHSFFKNYLRDRQFIQSPTYEPYARQSRKV